jgi:protein ImuA
MVADLTPLAPACAGDDPCLPEPGRDLAALRRRIRALEPQGRAPIPLGAPRLDAALGGGLKPGAVHEVAAGQAGDGAAAFLFALALASRMAGDRPCLAVMEASLAREIGAPDGHGLAAHGFEPARLLLVRAARPVEALWALEEGLRCAALGAVVAGLARLPRLYDLTLSRRFALAARDSGVTGALAILAEGGADSRLSSAAETRWRIRARPGRRGLADEPLGLALSADLVRRRNGDPASFDLEWSHDQRRFADAVPIAAQPIAAQPLPAVRGGRSGFSAATLPVAVAAASADRSGQAA